MAKNWERLNNHLFPHLGAYPIENITPPLLINAVKPLYEQGKNDTMHRNKSSQSSIKLRC